MHCISFVIIHIFTFIFTFAFRLYSFIPSVLLFICNISILVRVMISRNTRRSQLNVASDSSARMTAMTAKLLLVSFAFFILTTPYCVCYILVRTPYYEAELMKVHDFQIAWASVFMLSYTNNAINGFLYCLTSAKFRNQMKILCKNNRVPLPRMFNLRRINYELL